MAVTLSTDNLEDGETKAPSRMPSAAVILLQIGVGILFSAVTYGIPLSVTRDAGEGAGIAAAVVATIVPTFVLLQLSFPAYLYYWLSLTLLQNTLVGLWLPDNYSGTVPLIVTESKTVSLMIAVLLGLPLITRFLRSNRRIATFLLLYFAWIVVSVRGLQVTAFAYGRNFIFPLLLFTLVAAHTADWFKVDRLALLKRIIGFAVGVMAAGVVAESVVGTTAWRVFVNSDKLVSLGGVSDTTRFFGVQLPRVAGFIVEPTNAGYIAAICAVLLVLIAVAEKKAPNFSWSVVFVAAVWLLIESSARSGFLMLALSLLSVVFLRFKLPPVRFYLLGILSAFAIVLVYVGIVKSPEAVIRAFTDPPSIVGGDSTTYHLSGLMSGIERGITSVIGHGLGVGGNFSGIDGAETALRGAAKTATGGESAWGVLSYQTGIVGLLLLIVLMLVIGRQWGPLVTTGFIVWSVTSMFAEASFGLQVASMIMIGIVLLRSDEPWPVSRRRQARIDYKQASTARIA